MPSNDLPANILLSRSQPLSPWLQEIIRTKLSELNLSDTNDNEPKDAAVSDVGLRSRPLSTPGDSGSWEILQQPSGSTPAPSNQADEKSVHASSCRLVEIGEFLVDLTTLTSKIASALVEAEDIKTYIEAHIQQLNKMHHLSDMDMVTYMSEKERDLNLLATKLEEMANETSMVWKRSPNPPYPMGDLPQATSTVLVSRRTNNNSASVSQIKPNSAMGPDFASESPAASWSSSTNNAAEETGFPMSMEAFQSIYPNLNRRGVGNWVCPYGEKCTKGGVRDGEVVIFGRNSSFKAHLQKHEKAFKCTIPGCKNTAGFARIDQLRRHKIEVHHLKPEEVDHGK
ncbi:hypothetical protein MGYG_09195 [Nannizzia gypsea CBS 118893]|uniref:C2H2-type domain-containing protein n=1 Tax=Arthroderma gypseum (strain ATCC MYA-4604 / CBS 118893) TaxID=535722 RepID=E4V5S8_ARTGP|nr:hypothetical protein MGYG_09195 [Nannizzia gypsea CBS 118893]EFR05453.1 hypothetical protein MGYG_09195 [Nannizzia gypsea CBS 118893]